MADTTPEAVVEERSYDEEFAAEVARRNLQKSGDTPVADPAETPAAEPAAEATKTEQPLEEILSQLSEPVAARVKTELGALSERARKLDLDNRSLAGRISAYQRRYEEAAGKRPAEAAKAATVEQTEEWVTFKNDYPQIAEAIEHRFAASTGAAQQPQIAELVQYVEHEQRSRFLQDAWDAVEAVHPGWRDVGRSKEFQTWKATSPTYDKLASSDDIADAIALFDLYAAHQLVTGSPGVDPAAAAESEALAARRGAQVEGARAPSNKSATPNENVDLSDPDQLFAFYANKSNKRLQNRYK